MGNSLEIATLGSLLPIGRSAKNPNAVRNNAIMNTKRSSTLCVMGIRLHADSEDQDWTSEIYV